MPPAANSSTQPSNQANDINAKAIAIQQADGIDVGPEWWEQNVTAVVGNDASEEEMLEAFTTAYDRDFPRGDDGKRHSVA